MPTSRMFEVPQRVQLSRRSVEARVKSRFDALLSDVILGPGESGAGLARRIAEMDSEIPIILMSGYSRSELDDGIAPENYTFLAKPLNLEEPDDPIEDPPSYRDKWRRR